MTVVCGYGGERLTAPLNDETYVVCVGCEVGLVEYGSGRLLW